VSRAAPSGPPLPEGFAVVLDEAARRIDGGSVLVGGAPLTVLRLSEVGARAVDALAAGTTVPPGGDTNRLARRLVDLGLAHPRPPPPRCAPPVTVVIPVRDDPLGLAATLACLGPVDQVLVVDDGSAEPVALGPQTAPVRVLRLERSRGPGGARQVGWEAATTPTVAFLDAGCRPGARWLDALLSHLTDPAVAAVAPRVRARAGPVTPAWLATYERARSPLDLGPAPAAVRPRSRVPYVPTAALVVRRSALQAVSGFDPGLRFGEDVDLVWRLAAAGWVVRYEPAATASSDARPSLGALLRQRFDYGTSAAPLAERHGSAGTPLAVSPWSAAAWGLASLGHPLLGLGVAGASTAALAPRLGALRHPWAEAARMVGGGHLGAGRLVTAACRRSWWPAVALACLCWPPARRPAVLAALVPPLLEHRSIRPAVGLPAWMALRLADDLAYGAGVWAGAARAHSAAALLPAWAPGRRDQAGRLRLPAAAAVGRSGRSPGAARSRLYRFRR